MKCGIIRVTIGTLSMPKLSFTLPNYDSAMTQLLRDIGDGLIKHDEILGQIRGHGVSHGGATRQVSSPEIVDTEMRSIDAMFEISRQAFIETDADAFKESIYNLFTSFHSKQKKHLFEVVDRTTEAVGNTIDAGGRNMWDAYIEMLKTLEMHFDKDGKHNYQIYMHPDTAKKVEQNPPTPEQVELIEKTIEEKRRDFYARKRSRKLS
ncbi:MAG: hypothetical protein ACR2G4_12825 [Pyrinomonadaceae bacterium]